MSVFVDYQWRTKDLVLAGEAFAIWWQADLGGGDASPGNMLGDPIADLPDEVILRARRGIAGMTLHDPETREPVELPPRGDPEYWYIAVRTTTTPDALPFDPAAYGLEPASPAESLAVLGGWAA